MKTRAVVIVMLFTLGSFAGNAGAAAGPQEETGTIILPAPDPQTGAATCFQGIPRRINMASQGTVSGPFGVIFDVDKATWNGKFKLEVATGPTGQEDLDIYFFLNFGPGIPEDPSMNSPSIIGEFNTTAVGGEKGSIPAQSTKAIVCMKGGVIADFSYVGTLAKKKKS